MKKSILRVLYMYLLWFSINQICTIAYSMAVDGYTISELYDLGSIGIVTTAYMSVILILYSLFFILLTLHKKNSDSEYKVGVIAGSIFVFAFTYFVTRDASINSNAFAGIMYIFVPILGPIFNYILIMLWQRMHVDCV